MQTSRRTFMGIAASASYLALMHQSSADDNRPHLTIAVQDVRTNLEPIDSNSLANVAWRVQYSVFDQPLRTDFKRNFQINYALATSLQRLDDVTYQAQLRKGVKFHDGREMTADDVAFSLGEERLLGDKAPGAAVRDLFQSSLKGVTAIDRYTVKFSLKAPDPIFLQRLGSWGAQVISADAWRKAGAYDKWSQRPVGTGPYRIGETRADDLVTLVAHDDYWGGRPPYASIRFKKVSELAARVAGLQAGDYDIVTDVTPDHIAEIKADSKLKPVTADSVWFRILDFCPRNCAPLADVKVRQAMALSIDRKALVDSLWAGQASIPQSWQLPMFGDLNDPSRAGPVFDPDKAKALLAKSQYRGEEIPFPTVGNYYPLQMTEDQALVEMWKAVGLNVKLVNCENWDQVAKIPGVQDDSSGAFYADPVGYLWATLAPSNWLQADLKGWQNDEFNDLGVKLGSVLDKAERKKMFQRMMDIVDTDDPPATIMHSMPFIYGMKAEINWTPNPVPHMDLGPKLAAEPVNV